MELWKKLVILTGQTGRGTVQIESSGAGVSVTLNVFGLPDLPIGEYALGVKTGVTAFRREVGSLGRIKSRFALPPADYGAVHFILFRTADEQSVLYGTTSPQKMWEANRMDGLRGGDKHELSKESAETSPSPQAFRYSQRKIEDFFYDIAPSPYTDTALAQENYFAFSERPAPTPPEERGEQAPRTETQRDTSAAEQAHDDETPSDGSAQAVRSVASPAREKPTVESLFERAQPDRKATIDAAATSERQALVRELRTLKKASAYTAEQANAVVTTADYYARVSAKLDALFAHAPAFSPLGEALPGTRWVKVDYDGTGRYYVIGLIGDAPSFIAYGVPGAYGACPPALEGADFVPLFADKPTGEGFWVLFQSARTGEEIGHMCG